MRDLRSGSGRIAPSSCRRARAGFAPPAFVPVITDAAAPASTAVVSLQATDLAVEIAGATVRVRGRPGILALTDLFTALRRSG
jgi:hypothetical protein